MTKLTAYEQLHGFLDDLESSLDLELPDYDCDNIVLCGMGGSAISGSITADIFNPYSKKYIHTLRNPMIPKWMNERTLAVISSYSGNTLETIRMYERAKAQGCMIIVMTAGGKLIDMAEKDGYLLMRIKPGMDPRHSIGYMIGYLACIMKHTGTDLTEKFREAIPKLREYRDVLEKDDSRAYKIAENLKNKVIMLLFDGGMKSVALRWKSELTENSKYIAMTKPLSDFDTPLNDNFSHNALHAVILTKDADSHFTQAAAERLKSASIGYELLERHTDSEIYDILSMIMLGDYSSLRMAEDRNADPRDVWPIMKLKGLLNERMREE